MSALHSVAADRLASTGAGSQDRVSAAEVLHEIIDLEFRDRTTGVYVIFTAVDDSDDEWGARSGVEVHAGRKREHINTVFGQPLVTIDYVRDQGGHR